MAERGIHRTATFFYGPETRGAAGRPLAFEEELRAIAQKLPSSAMCPPSRTKDWDGETGLITTSSKRLTGILAGAHRLTYADRRPWWRPRSRCSRRSASEDKRI